MTRSDHHQNTSLGESGFEKKGGYASPKTPVAHLPKVPAGPAPGASTKPAQDSTPQK